MVAVTFKDRQSTNWIRKQWCDLRYQEHKRKQTQLGWNPCQEKVTTDGQSESQNGYPVDIKELEAD